MNNATEITDCALCGQPTRMVFTKRCDPCWELERRIESAPEIARKILEGLPVQTSESKKGPNQC
jgi:hypothetical protein